MTPLQQTSRQLGSSQSLPESDIHPDSCERVCPSGLGRDPSPGPSPTTVIPRRWRTLHCWYALIQPRSHGDRVASEAVLQ